MTGNVVSGNGLEPGYTNMLMTEHSANGTVLLGPLQQQQPSDMMGSTFAIQPTSEHGDTNLLLGAPMASYVTEQPTYVLTAATSATSVTAMLDSYNRTAGEDSCTSIYPQPVYDDQPFNYTNREKEPFCCKPVGQMSSTAEGKGNERVLGTKTAVSSVIKVSPVPIVEGGSPSAAATGSPLGPTLDTLTDSTCQ